MLTGTGSIKDGEEISIWGGGQEWQVSWYPSDHTSEGTPHGSAGVCCSPDLRIVLVSRDGENWGFPGGRPEGNETWEETLRREVHEEACSTVKESRLLGFSRSRCVSGSQERLILARAFWQSRVKLEPWLPQFEIPFRWVFPRSKVRDVLSQSHPGGDAPIVLRVFDKAIEA